MIFIDTEDNIEILERPKTHAEILKYIGYKIREKRKNIGLTIDELAEILDIAAGFLGLIERGQRGTSIKRLFKIADFFEISIDELTGFRAPKTKTAELTESEMLDKAIISFLKPLNNYDKQFILAVVKEYSKVKKVNGLEAKFLLED